MVVGPLLRAVAPRLMSAAAEKGLQYAASKGIGAAAVKGLTSVPGQRLVGRVGGEPLARAVASPMGRKIASKGIAREARQAMSAEGETPKPAAMPTTPVSEEANPNLMQSPDTPIGRRQRQQGWQDNGTMGSRFGSGGGGWWTAASIMDPMQAGYDWRTLSDTSVARGPASWNMAGKGMGRRIASRARGFADGYAGANGQSVEPEPVVVDDPFGWAQDTGTPTGPPIRRTDAFNQGTQQGMEMPF